MRRLVVMAMFAAMMSFPAGCTGNDDAVSGDGLERGNVSEVQETGSGAVEYQLPPADEFDSIVKQSEDGRYYLCQKTESGFDANAVMYGIYDSELAEWTYPFAELPELVVGEDGYDPDNKRPTPSRFFYFGEGVFGYPVTSYFGSKIHFMSSDKGCSFVYEYSSLSDFTDDERIRFVDGNAFLMTPQDSYYSNGRSSSSNNLCRLSTMGELQDVPVAEFENQDFIYWGSRPLSDSEDTRLFAILLDDGMADEDEGDDFIYVYFYDTGDYALIGDQMYVDRVHYDNDKRFQTLVSLNGDLIRIERLQGDDGQMYYAEFDREGNLVTEATLM